MRSKAARAGKEASTIRTNALFLTTLNASACESARKPRFGKRPVEPKPPDNQKRFDHNLSREFRLAGHTVREGDRDLDGGKAEPARAVSRLDLKRVSV